MNEDEYRNMYARVNPQGCVFEKMTLLNYGKCEYSQKHFMAEREAMGCQAKNCREDCQQLLTAMRKNARFSLKITHASTQLPHSQELKVQVGGMYGLQQCLDQKDPGNTEELTDNQLRYDYHSSPPVKDIHKTIIEAKQKFGKIEQFPYTEIVKTIMHFNLSSRRKKK